MTLGADSMNIAMKKIDGVTLIELPGRSLDASNARDFKAAAAPLLQQSAKLVIDMGKLEFVDSTGLGALVACLRQAHGTNGDIKLCGLTKPVRALFELVRMHRVFEIFSTPEEAQKSYQAA
jgi:anti-sigma B factor antagonist